MASQILSIDQIKRPILGASPQIEALKKLIVRVAPSKTNVLIIGESGTGKELVARALHELSPVHDQAFIAVNCGAIPETLIESELFGHKKGSFTGAIADKPGLFEAAAGGTLFLDEIGELAMSMQVKLLRALQDRAIRRVGGNETIKVDVRIVAATNRNLEEGVKNGTFREDLYYRLNVIMLETPPLRERVGDVEMLAEGFLKKFSEKLNRKPLTFSKEALEVILTHRWPGNIRELENIMERVATLESQASVQASSLPPEMVAAARKQANQPRELTLRANFMAGVIDLEKVLDQVRTFYKKEALLYTKDNEDEAKKLLGIKK
ncbi:MAG: sigma-54-dependent Fis family transcriptional regulator [Bdellovibrionales bacterium]|nr:sigma-54-dependent Fis family transcriptional regulator [Bdellovibrionales bacterium]